MRPRLWLTLSSWLVEAVRANFSWRMFVCWATYVEDRGIKNEREENE